jgi:hypothetical protein
VTESRTSSPDIFGADFSLHNDPAKRYKLIKEFVDKNFSVDSPGARMKTRFESETSGLMR